MAEYCPAEMKGKIKRWYFKANRPPWVKEPTLRTCVCRYHNEMQFALQDLSKAPLFKDLHAACRCGQGPCGASCPMCKDGACLDLFMSRSGLVTAVLCEPPPASQEYGMDALHKWSCAAAECGECGHAREDHLPRLPRCTALPAALERERDAHAEDDEENRTLMRRYTKKAQTQMEEDDHERQWDAAVVGGSDDPKSRVKEAEMLQVDRLTLDEALKYVKRTLIKYTKHNHIARHQAREFQNCKRRLRVGDIMIIVDFAMNWCHRHQDELQSAHWCPWQTTLLIFVVYRRVKGGLRLEGHVFYSDDLNHSNKMVQHCFEIEVKHYQKVMREEGGSLQGIHIW